MFTARFFPIDNPEVALRPTLPCNQKNRSSLAVKLKNILNS